MARAPKTEKFKIEHITVRKKTSIGGSHSSISPSMMNKKKRASYKKYRGQGR